MTVRYLIKLEPDDNDTLRVTCPAPSEVATFGEDEADAVRRARDATPTSRSRGRAVALPLMAALKVSLYRSLREAGLTRAELMRRLGWNRESADCLFRLDHASRLDQLEAAFKALGRSVDMSIKRAA
jgi:antitoxin HicB